MEILYATLCIMKSMPESGKTLSAAAFLPPLIHCPKEIEEHENVNSAFFLFVYKDRMHVLPWLTPSLIMV